MKKLFRIFIVIAAFGCMSYSPFSAVAQEWSDVQKKVWTEVESYWDLHAKGDLEGFLNYFHADYIGWYNRSAMPGDKDSLRKWLKEMFETKKVVLYEIKPVAISVYGDVAVIHYYYSQVVQYKPEKKHHEEGRWTDILMKQGGKWMLIGDHGGPRIGK
ncbi:MAG: DUF4440 domain-containing protein [Marinifilaceae bacterium]